LALKCRRGFLERKSPRNFIGRCSPVTWPPRSPDLTACFIVAVPKGCRLPFNVGATTQAAAAAAPYTVQLTDVLTEREYRHVVCRADDGVSVSVCQLLSVDHKSSIVLTASLTK
jgi:hypothetical protein